jgi:hypothetical protein
MALTKNQIASLKKNLNVSKDAEKTIERVQSDFKAAKSGDKKTVAELSGQALNSIYRIFKTGSINARILLAMSQTLNVNPFYYTGEVDEKTELETEHISQFLKNHGYDALLNEIGKPSAKRPYNRKPKADNVPVTETTDNEQVGDGLEKSISTDAGETEMAVEAVKEIKLLFSDEPQMKKAVEELTEAEAAELLHTLFIRAKGGGEAAKIADVVKRCLLK